ncbi:MAG: hypothetical protein HQK96_15040 [Nitrospirae bacterium]|nr:hypothetical protein [Nitrospirota bacterium]
MSDKETSQFSAADPLTGYLYQCRVALIESLRRIRNGEEITVSLETLDDVVFESKGKPRELLQTKHHLNKTPNLTDASPDIWKTIRIWSKNILTGNVPAGSTFFLITTASAPEGTAAHYLKADAGKRNTDKALKRLNATAGSSTNKDNAAGCTAFLSLSMDQKTQLLRSVYVMDNAPLIIDIEKELHKELFHAVKAKHLESFLKRLEGWWLERAMQHLITRDSKPITGEEILDEENHLREQFKQDSLPIDDDILNATIEEYVYQDKTYQDRTFVHQLKLIDIGKNRIFYAILNYYKAFEQRSRWVREDPRLVGELGRYEDLLMEEWKIRFAQMEDTLGKGAAEEANKQAAKTLYEWVETGALESIRSGLTQHFIARGSYQILADDLRVGWHPKFIERLKFLLEPEMAKL